MMMFRGKVIFALMFFWISVIFAAFIIWLFAARHIEQSGGKPPAESSAVFSPAPPAAAAPSEPDNMFAAKGAITEKFSQAVIPQIMEISGLEGIEPLNARISEPYIRVEEYNLASLLSADIRVGGEKIASPDVLIVEKYVSAPDEEGPSSIPLTVTAMWNTLNEKRSELNYWLPDGVNLKDKYARGNPDGSVSLFVFPRGRLNETLELRSANAADEANGKLLSVTRTFRSPQASAIKNISAEIGRLCGLQPPLKTGDWTWRQTGGIPDSDMKRTKSAVDGGLVAWRELVEWNGYPLVTGNVTTWNGILLSLELIAVKEDYPGVWALLKNISEVKGFSVESEEEGHVVKIRVSDDFMFNFSALWGF